MKIIALLIAKRIKIKEMTTQRERERDKNYSITPADTGIREYK
jgi:hypothetical protein